MRSRNAGSASSRSTSRTIAWRVPGGDDERALAVGERIGGDAYARRDDRQPGGHRFDERDAESFVQARRNHDVGIAIEVDERETLEARDDVHARTHDRRKVGKHRLGGRERPGADQPDIWHGDGRARRSHLEGSWTPFIGSHCPTKSSVRAWRGGRSLRKNSGGTPCETTSTRSAVTQP